MFQHDSESNTDYWSIKVDDKDVFVYERHGVLYINEPKIEIKKHNETPSEDSWTISTMPEQQSSQSAKYHQEIVESFGKDYTSNLPTYDKVYLYDTKRCIVVYKDDEQVKVVYTDNKSMYIHSVNVGTFVNKFTVESIILSNDLAVFEYSNQPLYKTWEWSYEIQRVDDDDDADDLANIMAKLDISDQKGTNESVGMTAEFLLCQHFGIECNISNNRLMDDPRLPQVLRSFPKTRFYDYQWIGNKNTGVDFTMKEIATGKTVTLSVKTTQNSSQKLCPQNIGQVTSLQKLRNHLQVPRSINEFDSYAFRKYIMDNIHNILPVYLDNLFVCDYMFYIDLKNETAYFLDEVAVKKQIVNPAREAITFTKTVETWNESNTVKFNGVTLGEFQLHRNRKCFKFRFNFNGLLELR